MNDYLDTDQDPAYAEDKFVTQQGCLRELLKTIAAAVAYVAAGFFIAMALSAAFPKGSPL